MLEDMYRVSAGYYSVCALHEDQAALHSCSPGERLSHEELARSYRRKACRLRAAGQHKDAVAE